MSVLQTFIYDPLVEWKTHMNSPSQVNATDVLNEIETKLKGRVHKESLPLSVHGHVQQLLREAASVENLSKMYIGWMSWM
jgi:serine/threonine-protein kinase ATR